MAYIMVLNKAGFPLHGALSWAGIQQDCFNDLRRDQSHDFVVGLGWTDLTVVPGGADNRFSSGKNRNFFETAGMFLLNAAFATSPGGALYISQHPTGVFQLGVEPSGPGSGRKDVKVVGKNIALKPVQVTGLYCPHGYTVTVTGGEVMGDYDDASNTFTIKDVTPLKLGWVNRTTDSRGTEPAPR